MTTPLTAGEWRELSLLAERYLDAAARADLPNLTDTELHGLLNNLRQREVKQCAR